MLHLHSHNDIVDITCDCGCLSISLAVCGKLPNRQVRCERCGESAMTADLLAQEKAPVVQDKKQPEKKNKGLVFRISASLMGIGRRAATT